MRLDHNGANRIPELSNHFSALSGRSGRLWFIAYSCLKKVEKRDWQLRPVTRVVYSSQTQGSGSARRLRRRLGQWLWFSDFHLSREETMDDRYALSSQVLSSSVEWNVYIASHRPDSLAIMVPNLVLRVVPYWRYYRRGPVWISSHAVQSMFLVRRCDTL